MIDCKRYRRIKLYALKTLPEGTVFSFRKGASVSLNRIPLPETMDFLNCAALEIKDCDWSAVRNVDFADEAQYKRYRNELPDAAEWRVERKCAAKVAAKVCRAMKRKPAGRKYRKALGEKQAMGRNDDAAF